MQRSGQSLNPQNSTEIYTLEKMQRSELKF